MLPYSPIHHLLLAPVPGCRRAGPRRAGADQRQPLRRAHLLHRRRCRATTFSLCATRCSTTTGQSTCRATTRWYASSTAGNCRSAGPAAIAPLPVDMGHRARRPGGAGGRRRTEEHLLSHRRLARLPVRAHRRHGHLGDAARVRARGGSAQRNTRRSQLRLAADLHPGVSHPQLGGAPRGRSTAGSDPAPPRARGVAAGRARAHRRTHRRRLVRRHRLRLRSNDLGRRDSQARARQSPLRPGRPPVAGAAAGRRRRRAQSVADGAVSVVDGRHRLDPGSGAGRCGNAGRIAAHPFTIGERHRVVCRVRAWAGCSMRSHRCSGCGTGSTTKVRPPSSSRRSPTRSATPAGPARRCRWRCAPTG